MVPRILTYRLEPGRGQTKLQMQAPAFHIQLLRTELQNRRAKAKTYSLRSFAADLAIDPSALSKILKGIKKLSVRSSLHVVKCIAFTEHEMRLFLASVAEEKSRDICQTLAAAMTPPVSFQHLQKYLKNLETEKPASTAHEPTLN